MKAIVADIGGEGEVRIPDEVRDILGLRSHGQVAFVITDDGLVQVQPPMVEVVERLRGVAGSLDSPLTWERIEEVVGEDRRDRLATKLGLHRSE